MTEYVPYLLYVRDFAHSRLAQPKKGSFYKFWSVLPITVTATAPDRRLFSYTTGCSSQILRGRMVSRKCM